MPFDWTSGALAEGLRCYRSEQFFEAHEHWEAVWLACEEPAKTFLQSLIQVSAAFHHLQRGNRTGAVSLLTRALRRLDQYPESFSGIEVERLRENVRVWLLQLATESSPLQQPYPAIQIRPTT